MLGHFIVNFVVLGYVAFHSELILPHVIYLSFGL